MKILIYSHYFLPSVGGVEHLVETSARGFAAKGHRVCIATATAAATFDDNALPYPVVRRPGLAALLRLIREHEVLHLAGPALLPMFLGYVLRKPVIVEHHMYQAICPNGLLLYQPDRSVCPGHFQAGRHGKCLRCNAGLRPSKSLRMWLAGFPRLWLCRRATTNVAVTEHVRRRLRLPNSLVIYHGTAMVATDEHRSTAGGREQSSPCFAYVGRFVSEKGLPVLIDAAARLKRGGISFRLKFIGDGPERKNLETAVAAHALEDRAVFTGMLGPEDLQRETAGVKALVMPSVWEETAGMAAIEQMMRGTPVVVSDIGGLGEVVNGAGLKFPAGDAAALAQCLRRIIEDPELSDRLGKQGRDRALDLFGLERRIDDHLRLCESIVKGQSSGGRRGSFLSRISGQMKTLIRSVVPRTARNWLRSPSKSAEWLWNRARFSCGVTCTAPLLPDWGLLCHPQAYKIVVRDQIEDPEQSAEFRNFVSYCTSTMFLFDVGAHFGVFSLAAAHFGGRAVAVDPSPAATRMIACQATLNGLAHKIQIVRAALSDEGGTLALLSSGVFSDGYFQVAKGRPKGELTEIPAITVDQMTVQFGVPTHVKIDVEGHEGAVIRGARHTLAEHSPVLFLEVHNETIRSGGGDPNSLLDELDRLGYALFSVSGELIDRPSTLAKPIVRIVGRRPT